MSIDIDPALTHRAATLHRERGVPNLALLTRDGHLGAAEHGPYDVILSWAAPTHIPQSWIEQAKPWAVISTPVYVAEVARCVGHLRAVVTDDGELDEPRLGKAGYVDMGEEINTSLGIPLFYLDALHQSGDNDLAWVSVAWRGHDDGHRPADTLAVLHNPGHREPILLGETAPHLLRHHWLHRGVRDRVLQRPPRRRPHRRRSAHRRPARLPSPHHTP